MRLTRTAAVSASRKKARKQDDNRHHVHMHHHHHRHKTHHPHTSWSGGVHPFTVHFKDYDTGLSLIKAVPHGKETARNVIVYEAAGASAAKHVMAGDEIMAVGDTCITPDMMPQDVADLMDREADRRAPHHFAVHFKRVVRAVHVPLAPITGAAQRFVNTSLNQQAIPSKYDKAIVKREYLQYTAAQRERLRAQMRKALNTPSLGPQAVTGLHQHGNEPHHHGHAERTMAALDSFLSAVGRSIQDIKDDKTDRKQSDGSIASMQIEEDEDTLTARAREWLSREELPPLRRFNRNLEKFLASLDKDGEGTIDYREWELYFKWAMELHAEGTPQYAGAVDERVQRLLVGLFQDKNVGQSAFDMFILFDDNKSGSISRAELTGGLMQLGVLHYNFEINGLPIRFADTSLSIFPASNGFRRVCVWLIHTTWWDRIILALIVLNSFVLAFEDHTDYAGTSWRNVVAEEAEVIFLLLFFIEMSVKIIAMGFCAVEGTYLRDPWNWIDFVVVITGVAIFVPFMPQVSSLRTFRVLRPLRTLSSMPGLRRLVGALLQSLPGLVNVVFLLLFAFAIFGVLGIQLFGGVTHFHCKATKFPVEGEWPDGGSGRTCSVQPSRFRFNCADGEYCGSDFEPPIDNATGMPYVMMARRFPNSGEDFNFGFTTFDTFPEATLTIFQVITMENWSHIMYMIMDGHGHASAVFFVILVVFGAFFLLNLVFAVIWDKFSANRAFGEDERAESDYSSSSSDSSSDESDSETVSRSATPVHMNPTPQLLSPMIQFPALPPIAGKSESVPASFCGEDNSNMPAMAAALKASVTLKKMNNRGRIDVNEDGRRQLVGKRARKGDDVHYYKSLGKKQETSDELFARRLAADDLTKGISSTPVCSPSTQSKSKSRRRRKKAGSVRSKSGIRSRCKKLIDHPQFGATIIIAIVANTVILALDSYDPNRSAEESKRLEDKFELGNLVLTVVFAFEMIVKLLALGIRGYVAERFNIFDGLIVISSVVEVAVKAAGSAESTSGIAVLRLFRIFRVFKLARSWRSLNNVIRTVVTTLVESVNFALLLLLAIFIFTLVGMQIFSTRFKFDPDTSVRVAWDPMNASHPDNHPPWDDIKPYEIPDTNFDDIVSALAAVFQCLSGEDWNAVMYDGIRARSHAVAITYFLSLIFVGNLVVLNLFLAILLGNFTVDLDEDDEDEDRDNQDNKAPGLCKRLLVRFGLLNDSGKVVPEVTKDNLEDVKAEQNWLYLERRSSVDTSASKALSKKQDLNDAKREADVRRRVHRLTLTGKSYFVFGPESKLRKFVSLVAVSKPFETFVLALIVASSVCLAVDNPLDDPDARKAHGLKMFNNWLCWIFFGEFVIRSIHLGFCLYLSDGWNQVDFVIVIVSLIDRYAQSSDVGTLRAVRALRALRPLRLVARLPNMKRVVDTMVATLPQAASVTGVCGLFFLIFGIFGTNQFKGKFWSCDLGDNATATNILEQEYGTMVHPFNNFKKHFTKTDCERLGGDWGNANQHFDNVLHSMLTLIQMSTTEGWVEVMHNGVNAVAPETQPVRGWKRGFILYFISFIVVGSFFAVNLFVGAVIDAFNALRDESGASSASYMTPTQREWVDTQLMVARARLKPKAIAPKGAVRLWAFNITQKRSFELCIMSCILANTVVLSTQAYQQSAVMTSFQKYVNYVFAIIFTVELFLKLLGHGQRYFMSKWNLFDFCVVLLTNSTILLQILGGADVGSFAGLARAIRLCLIFRIFQSAQGMQSLLSTVVVNLPSLINISLVLALLLFIFSVMAMQLFAEVALQENLNGRANFQTFAISFLTLFRACTGEAWNSIMSDCMLAPSNADVFLPQEGGSCVMNPSFSQFEAAGQTIGCGREPWLTYTFFLLFVLSATMIMLNLFVAVILEGFGDQQYEGEKSLTDDQFQLFCARWLDFDIDANYVMDGDSVIAFLRSLPPPMGVKGYALSERDARKFAGRLNLPDYHGQVQFHDMCTALARQVYLNNARRAGLDTEDVDAVSVEKLGTFADSWLGMAEGKAKVKSSAVRNLDGEVFTWQDRMAAKAFQKMWATTLARREARKVVDEKRAALQDTQSAE